MEPSSTNFKHVFGPVPSRRLGRSLGIDLVPYKTCTFDCIYCDLGRTTQKIISRQSCFPPDQILGEFQTALSILERKPDFVTMSGSGEPTLNQDLGKMIRGVKNLTSVPVAALTNGSLLWMKEVRDDLLDADVVLPSLDAATPLIFEHINRPCSSLNLNQIISGLVQFRKEFRHQIWLEIVFCRGINDGSEEVEALRKAIERINPDRIQLNTPVRPPVEEYAYPLVLDQLEKIRKTFGDKAEIISDVVGPLGCGDDSDKDTQILELIRRRPCTAEDISRSLEMNLNEVMKHLSRLAEKGAIHHRMHQHHCYYEKTLVS